MSRPPGTEPVFVLGGGAAGAGSATGTGTGSVRTVAREVLRIGRGTNADLRFDDPRVALEHARVERTADGFVVSDLGSLTGTYVGGRPVEEPQRLADGDLLEVGGQRLRVRLPAAAGPLLLEVEPAAAAKAEPAPAAPAGREASETDSTGPEVAARPVDYLRAYSLPHGLLGKGALSVALLLVVVAGVAWVARAGRTDAFRPGALSAAHRREIAPTRCAACHAPWRGPATARCAECHSPNRVLHQASQVRNPGCGECHFEHRGADRLQVVADADCTVCHADLRVVPGAVPRFASGIRSFADHPELAVDWRRANAASGVSNLRLRLDTPEGRSADPATLRLNHAVHLKPGLLSPEAPGGRETLTCESCHQLAPPDDAPAAAGRVAKGGPATGEAATGEAAVGAAAAGTADGAALPAGAAVTPSGLLAITYEAHCRRCHLLVFDKALPPAPHVPPDALRDRLRGAYSGDAERGRSVGEQRRRVVRGTVSSRSRTELRTLEERALQAEYDLYRSACVTCHQVDLEAVPYPKVAPPGLRSRRWLAHARFSHATHLAYTDRKCVDCHPAAATSTQTSDVLLPSIAVCRPCHGAAAGAGSGKLAARSGDGDGGAGGGGDGGAAVGGRRGGGLAPMRCVDCHTYHPRTEAPPADARAAAAASAARNAARRMPPEGTMREGA